MLPHCLCCTLLPSKWITFIFKCTFSRLRWKRFKRTGLKMALDRSHKDGNFSFVIIVISSFHFRIHKIRYQDVTRKNLAAWNYVIFVATYFRFHTNLMESKGLSSYWILNYVTFKLRTSINWRKPIWIWNIFFAQSAYMFLFWVYLLWIENKTLQLHVSFLTSPGPLKQRKILCKVKLSFSSSLLIFSSK